MALAVCCLGIYKIAIVNYFVNVYQIRNDNKHCFLQNKSIQSISIHIKHVFPESTYDCVIALTSTGYTHLTFGQYGHDRNQYATLNCLLGDQVILLYLDVAIWPVTRNGINDLCIH